MSTLFVNNLNTASGTTITVPTGKVMVGTDGGTFKSPGQILQTLHAENNTYVAYTSTSYTATSVSLAITPKYATSKILVSLMINGEYISAQTTAMGLALFADSGSGFASLIEFEGNAGYTAAGTGRIFGGSTAFQYLHDVNTTNATTYKVYAKRIGGSGNLYINNYASAQTTRSSIVCQEIAQ